MTTEALAGEPIAVTPTALSDGVRGRILIYLAVLIVMLGFGSPFGGLIDVPISFFLKNKLHLKAHEVADFRLIAAIPLYLSFAFGFARDTWNPLGMRDRGFMVLFGSLAACVYLFFAFTQVTYLTLLAAVILLSTSFLFVQAAQYGLTAAMGQQHVMSGQVSTVWNIFLSVPLLAAYVMGGLLSDQLEGRNADQAARILFLVGAGIMASIALYGIWKPRSVYNNIHAEHRPAVRPWQDFKRLVRHWPIYPALLIWFLFSFAPGSSTPLQYFLQNTLHANDAEWGAWNAIFAVSFIPTYMVFGLLCRHFPLKTLLFWGTVVAVPQMVPLYFIHSVAGSLVAAAACGLMGGVGTAAYMDLIIRSCPPGLQGTVAMMSSSLYYIAIRFGDVLGTQLYDHFGGFGVCVIAITTVYACILPVIWLVPKALIATTDGVAPKGGFGAD